MRASEILLLVREIEVIAARIKAGEYTDTINPTTLADQLLVMTAEIRKEVSNA